MPEREGRIIKKKSNEDLGHQLPRSNTPVLPPTTAMWPGACFLKLSVSQFPHNNSIIVLSHDIVVGLNELINVKFLHSARGDHEDLAIIFINPLFLETCSGTCLVSSPSSFSSLR